ncbi:MAG TPA: hypothetical protein VKZ59_12540 [Acidobacteriota bacterium]|nr:hypothetical protein [Acidobacteriota bacterium]
MGLFKKKVKESFQPNYTDKLPLVPFKILETDIPIYSDPECKQQVPEGRILILLGLGPDEKVVEEEIVPTRLRYQKDQYVTWSFNSKKVWEDCWYIDPRTGEITKAWGLHVEFTGAVISSETVAANRDHLQDLETRTLERLKEQAERLTSTTSVHVH